MTPTFRKAAEWEPHKATWLAWPYNASDWPGKLSAIYWVYTEIIRHIAEGEEVYIFVQTEKHQAQAKQFLKEAHANLKNLTFIPLRMNRGWTRDCGPFFVKRGKKSVIANFRFNAWAKYSNWRLDETVAKKVSQKFKLPLIEPVFRKRRFVLEGGAIDSNGHGTILTTSECLLDPKTQVRNPGLSKRDNELVLRKYLGASRIIWLGKGITGDDTHGHIDDICRFVNLTSVVLCCEKNTRDKNYKNLRENRERLKETKLHVIELPMPSPLYFQGGRLPASYANFYISNAAVLVPTFNDPRDRIALGILAECFPKRKVIGIHAVDLVWGFGTLHCLTSEQPA